MSGCEARTPRGCAPRPRWCTTAYVRLGVPLGDTTCLAAPYTYAQATAACVFAAWYELVRHAKRAVWTGPCPCS
eukprot:352333-Chlamydomonas_euryale.AAC.1